jgi:hypothetical protein
MEVQHVSTFLIQNPAELPRSLDISFTIQVVQIVNSLCYGETTNAQAVMHVCLITLTGCRNEDLDTLRLQVAGHGFYIDFRATYRVRVKTEGNVNDFHLASG